MREDEKTADDFAAADGEILRFAFRGGAAEYFRIWLVNVSLTLLTLGIFSAWAKVRTLRYFYANTFLDGANFEYHARPLSILVARIIVFAILIGGGYASDNFLLPPLLYSLVLFLFLPWAMVRGLSFNARNSSYRNIRFSFRRDYKTPYLLYALMATGIGIFALPWLVRGWHSFKATRHQIGKTKFVFRRPSVSSYIAAELSVKIPQHVFRPPHILPYIVALWILPMAAFMMIGMTIAFSDAGGEAAFTALIAAFVLAAFFYAQAILFLTFWRGVQSENGAYFICEFTAPQFAFLLLTNFIAALLSFGLLHPWAKVRKTKFLAERMYIVAPPGTTDEIFARRGQEEGAFGEELDAAEGFDFDAGLV